MLEEEMLFVYENVIIHQPEKEGKKSSVGVKKFCIVCLADTTKKKTWKFFSLKLERITYLRQFFFKFQGG